MKLTILEIKQTFSLQKYNGIVLLGFWLTLLLWMFISSCTAIYFFVKNVYSNEYSYSVNTVFECCYLFYGWEIGHPLSKCASGGMEEGVGGGDSKYIQMVQQEGIENSVIRHIRTKWLWNIFCALIPPSTLEHHR